MGCGGSKLDSSAEPVPVRIRPLLRRRYEEIQKRRNGYKGSTLSKKYFLRDDSIQVQDGDNSPPHSIDGDSFNESKAYPQVALEPESEYKDNDEDKIDDDDDDIILVAKNLIAEMLEQNGNDEEEVEVIEEVDGSMVCPASPSFRIYCVEALEISSDEDKEDKVHKNSETGQSDKAESTSPNEETRGRNSETKNGKKGVQFRKVAIQKGKGKRLFNVRSFDVTSCYYPSCGGGHDDHRTRVTGH